MERLSTEAFLRRVGHNALSIPLYGTWTLVRQTIPSFLPPNAAPPQNYGSVEEQAELMLKGYNLPGMAIGLIRDKKLVYAGGFGVANAATRKPMTEYSVMAMASMSKMLTGAAILLLNEAGLLTEDDNYVDHVPSFKMEDPRYRDITIHNLLAHTSGLPEANHEDFNRECNHPWYDDDSAERLVRSLATGTKLSQAPGAPDSPFLYSDIGYDILAALVQEVSGELFEEYQQRHILGPLQMHKSTFLKTDVSPQDLAAAHIRGGDGNPQVLPRYPYTRQHGPSSLFFSNIIDMSHWVMANLNGGVYFNRIMQPETQVLLWEPMYDDPWDWRGVGYSPGFFTMMYAETGLEPTRMVLSGGGQLGSYVHITIFPEYGIAAIVFVNLKSAPEDPDYSLGICTNLALQLLRGEL